MNSMGFDSLGIQGLLLHYGMIATIVGGGALVFFYLWKSQRLDMDEEPKWQMMEEEHE
ncbi:MAG: hypothetical protein Tsb0021_02820 [Chlamydiales bacterium]